MNQNKIFLLLLWIINYLRQLLILIKGQRLVAEKTAVEYINN